MIPGRMYKIGIGISLFLRYENIATETTKASYVHLMTKNGFTRSWFTKGNWTVEEFGDDDV